MSADKGLTNTFSSGIRIWTLVNFLVLFHWKLHKNCMSTILPGNITYSKNQTTLQNLHLVWVQRPIWSPCWISLEWWLLWLPSSLWGLHKLCCGDNSSCRGWSYSQNCQMSISCPSPQLNDQLQGPSLTRNAWCRPTVKLRVLSFILLNSLVPNVI